MAIFDDIATLSNQFYELIPHADNGVDQLSLIDHEHVLQSKFEMLKNLGDYEIASKILLGAQFRIKELNPLDYVYQSLRIDVEELGKDNNEAKIIKKYAVSTGCTCEILSVFKLQRKGEPHRINQWKNLPNHLLLWHGSSVSNFIGILYHGLKIAPKEAPVSGYAFGKGIYFADVFEKSLGYCRVDSRSGTGFILLCEVALGTMYETDKTEYMETAHQGFNSTKALGQMGPDFNNSVVLPNGVKIPYGSSGPLEDPKLPPTRFFQHNEYIVYDESQVRLRYMIQFKQ